MKIALATILLLATTSWPQAANKTTSEYPSPTIREESQVVVNSVTETWRLEWAEPPKPYCEPSEGSLTCPCTGFAYGEAGDLYLVRLRAGKEIDRLHLTPLFADETNGKAVLQRWAPDYDADFAASDRSDFAELVRRRPTVPLLHVFDYDHDGNATEFYLQTEVLACGKRVGVVIGVSKNNPRLHVFGTASHLEKPLYMQRLEWDALREASSASLTVVDWTCGDHGAETQTELTLQWSSKGIDGVRREYACSENGKTNRLVHEDPLN